MSLSSSIPRFLLPQRGAIWRTRFTTPATTIVRTSVRQASKNKSKPKASNAKPEAPPGVIVLEKPAKFNPPSHGSRRPKPAPRYPGPRLSDEEKAMQATKKYPHMMPAEGTFMHWFINNRSIHVYITLGTLLSLGFATWVNEFNRTSPFADMVPAWHQLFLHPISYVRTLIEVLKLHTARSTAETMERRMRKVEDVQKRAAYRKAHGLDQNEGFGGWTAKTDAESIGPVLTVPDLVVEGVQTKPVPVDGEPARETRPPVKKWFGIW